MCNNVHFSRRKCFNNYGSMIILSMLSYTKITSLYAESVRLATQLKKQPLVAPQIESECFISKQLQLKPKLHPRLGKAHAAHAVLKQFWGQQPMIEMVESFALTSEWQTNYQVPTGASRTKNTWDRQRHSTLKYVLVSCIWLEPRKFETLLLLQQTHFIVAAIASQSTAVRNRLVFPPPISSLTVE